MRTFFKVVKLFLSIVFGVAVLIVFLPLILLIFLVLLLLGNPGSVKFRPSGIAGRFGFGGGRPGNPPPPAGADTIDISATEVVPESSENQELKS